MCFVLRLLLYDTINCLYKGFSDCEDKQRQYKIIPEYRGEWCLQLDTPSFLTIHVQEQLWCKTIRIRCSIVMLSCFDAKRTWQKEGKKAPSCPNKDNRLFCIFLQCVLQGLYFYCIWVIHMRRIESLCEESQIPIFSEDEQLRAVMITLHSSLCFCSLKQRSGEWVSFISVLVALIMHYCIKQSGSEKESELSKAHQHKHA